MQPTNKKKVPWSVREAPALADALIRAAEDERATYVVSEATGVHRGNRYALMDTEDLPVTPDPGFDPCAGRA
ncbi:hypothetical protein [Nocardia rhamnosiphila]